MDKTLVLKLDKSDLIRLLHKYAEEKIDDIDYYELYTTSISRVTRNKKRIPFKLSEGIEISVIFQSFRDDD